MTTFTIGGLEVDAIEYGSQGSAVLGIRDSGKTYSATLLAEKLFEAGIPFTAFDPIGVWRFLRVPGKGRGYPVVVAGGQAGDLPLTPASAPAIVEAAMQNGISLVVDLFSLDLSKSDWRRIVMESVRLMLHRNAAHGLRHVFIEEAAEFIPQKVIDGQVYAEVEKLARMGGNARLGYTLINQRAEEVNKAVLELCDNLFLHRQKGRRSLEALTKWLALADVKDVREITSTMATLPQGECWAWLAGTDRPVRIKVPAKNSFHPDRRIMRGAIPDLARQTAVDVGGFVERMRGALTEVEEQTKANDPKALKARIAELEKQVKVGGKPAVDQEAVARAWQNGAAAARADMAGNVVALLATAEAKLYEAIGAAIREISSEIREPAPTPKCASPAPVRAAAAPVERRKTANGASADTLPRHRKILDAVAWFNALGIDQPTRIQVAFMAGKSPKGGSFNNDLGALRTAGMIDYPTGGCIVLTDEGRAIAEFPEHAGGAEDLHRRVYACLRVPRLTSMLQELVAVYPDPLSREDLAERVGKSAAGGSFNNDLGRLRSLGVIDYPRSGQVRAEDLLFP